MTIPEDTTCLWSHSPLSYSTFIWPQEILEDLQGGLKYVIPWFENFYLLSLYLAKFTQSMGLCVCITSQEMFPDSLTGVGASDICSLSTHIARSTILMTLYRLPRESVFSDWRPGLSLTGAVTKAVWFTQWVTSVYWKDARGVTQVWALGRSFISLSVTSLLAQSGKTTWIDSHTLWKYSLQIDKEI